MLISHNFDQVLRVADDVRVMRAGRTVGRRETEDTTGEELVGLVTGAISTPTRSSMPGRTHDHDRHATRTRLGLHALVWVGDWTPASAKHAISSTAALGFDLIEVPFWTRRRSTRR